MEVYDAITSESELSMQIMEIESRENQRMEKLRALEILKQVIEYSEYIIEEQQLENNKNMTNHGNINNNRAENDTEKDQIVEKLGVSITNLKHENEKLKHQFVNQKASFENKIDKLTNKNKQLSRKIETLHVKIKKEAMEFENFKKENNNLNSPGMQNTPNHGGTNINNNGLLSQFSTSPYLRKYQRNYHTPSKKDTAIGSSSDVRLTSLKIQISEPQTEDGNNNTKIDKTKLSKILKNKRKSLLGNDNSKRTGNVRKSISGDLMKGILNDFDETENNDDSLQLKVSKTSGNRKTRVLRGGNSKVVNLYGKDEEDQDNIEEQGNGNTLLGTNKKSPFARLMNNDMGPFSPKPKKKNIFQI